MDAFKQGFQALLQLPSNLFCETCPLNYFHRLCLQLEGTVANLSIVSLYCICIAKIVIDCHKSGLLVRYWYYLYSTVHVVEKADNIYHLHDTIISKLLS